MDNSVSYEWNIVTGDLKMVRQKADQQILLSSFVAVESAHAFSAFCPSILTIKSFATDDAKKMMVREGYVLASVFSLALAGIVSKLIGSWNPLYFSIGTIVFMIAVYEWALKGESISGIVESGI